MTSLTDEVADRGDRGSDIDVSVLVVNYRTRDLTLTCLRSLYAETRDVTFETIVVDNASGDGSAEAIAAEFPGVDLIASPINVGFGAANNLAAERARGEYLLLLNPDTEVCGHAIDRIVAFARAEPGRGLWGGRTVFPDGSLNRGSCWAAPTLWSALCLAMGWANRFPDVRWLHPEGMGSWRRDSVREVDIVSGCFMLVESRLWESLGGFDRAFFMYGEDADLSLRARARGARPTICPDATIMHLGGASERVRADKMVRLFQARAFLYRRYWSPARAWLGVRLLDLWALVRVAGYGLGALASRRHRSNLAQWRSVWQRRGIWRAAPPRVGDGGDGSVIA